MDTYESKFGNNGVIAYESKFGNNGVIANLSKCGFHGKLIINFTDGVPQSSKVEMSVLPQSNATVRESSMCVYTAVNALTLKEGDKKW